MLGLGLSVAKAAPRRLGGGGGATGPAWLYSRSITVDNTGNTAKTDYPVKISLTSANFNFAHAQANGEDVRLFNAGSPIPHWIESWDSVGQTAVVWTSVAAISAGGTATLELQYGNASAANASDIHGPFIFGEDFNDRERLVGYPNKTYATQQGAYGIVLGNRLADMVVGSGVTGAWDETVREQANVVYDPDDPDPNKRYKFYYTGQVLPAGTGTRRVGLTCSPDGYTWTPYSGNPVIGEGEDSYIVRNIDGSLYRDPGGLMHLFCEDQAQLNTLHYTSADGLAWTADPANPVISRGPSGSYDDAIVASPIVIHLGGDNSFILVYEGRSSVSDPSNTIGTTTETTCLARATGLMGRVWTKDPTNPVFDGDVPDDLVFTGTEWIYLYHNTASDQRRAKTTAVDPALWDNTSFVDYGPNPVWPGAGGWSYNSVPEGEAFGRRCTTQPSANPTTRFDLYDVMGSDQWEFQRLATSPRSPEGSTITAKGDGSLVLLPETGSVGNSIMVSTRQLSLTNNFQIMMRRKAEDGNGDNRLAQIGFGAGNVTFLAGNGGINYMPDGYFFLSSNPGAAGALQIRKYAAAAETTLSTGLLTEAEASNFNRHEISYLSSGALRYALNGAQKVTATDTAHVGLAKQLLISQGHTGSNPGAKQTVDWVAVRKWDGQDPAIAVGAEALR